jgi:hypothetical protein
LVDLLMHACPIRKVLHKSIGYVEECFPKMISGHLYGSI